MLLSYNKPGQASSSLPDHETEKAFDEDIRTYWAAASGNKGEWLTADLGHACTVNAVQVNFAEHGTRLFGRAPNVCHRYTLDYSLDGGTWGVLVDRSNRHEDLTHEYFEFESPVTARYVRLKNKAVPDGSLAVSGLRVFGTGGGDKPKAVERFAVQRDPKDPRRAVVTWDPDAGTDGAVVRFGTSPGKLYLHYQVQGENRLEIRALNRGVSYWFAVDRFNENGYTQGNENHDPD
jgi:hypothetical protein